MPYARARLKTRSKAQGDFLSSDIVPSTGTLLEGSAENTAIGVVKLNGAYTAAVTVELLDDENDQLKLGASNQLQAGPTPTDFETDPALAPTVRVTATNGGMKRVGTIPITILDDGLPETGNMVPGALWDGTGPSGFGNSPPVDPPRTTAKPIIRMLQPDHLHISEGMKLRVRAEAKGGIEKVICHFGGNSYESLTPVVATIAHPRAGLTTAGGYTFPATYKVICYEFPLNRSDFPGDGDIDVYFEAVPNDGTMQHRVIGPYRYYKYGASVYDANITVGIGLTQNTATGVFNDLKLALQWCGQNGKRNPLITITVTGTYGSGGSTFKSAPKGRARVTTAPGITATLANATRGEYRLSYDGIHFYGPGIVFDMANIISIYHEGLGNYHVLEGVRITNSTGPYPLQNGNTSQPPILRFTGWSIGCFFEKLEIVAISSQLLLANHYEACSADLTSFSNAVIGNTGRGNYSWGVAGGVDTATIPWSTGYRGWTDALAITYAGAGTGTVAKVGTGAQSINHIIRLVDPVNGTTDFPLGSTYYTIPALATAISAVPGWTATAMAPGSTRRSAALTIRNSTRGGVWGGVSANAGLTLTTSFDVHSDWFQAVPPAGGVQQNAIIAENAFTIFDGTVFRATSAQDLAFINNAFEVFDLFEIVKSTFSDTQSHILIWHNSLPDQEFFFSGNTAQYPNASRVSAPYSEFYGNVAMSMTNNAVAAQHIDSNHIMAGNPAGGTNTVTGGSMASLFVNAPAGDFTPQGALLSNLITPKAAYDGNCLPRGVTDAHGAWRVPV